MTSIFRFFFWYCSAYKHKRKVVKHFNSDNMQKDSMAWPLFTTYLKLLFTITVTIIIWHISM